MYIEDKSMCIIPNPTYSKDKDSQIDYICKILERHEKEKLCDIRNKLYELNDKRVLHIISVFYLGLYFYENEKIKIKVDKAIDWLLQNDINKESCQDRFEFVWMLICLFHDIGYVVEEKDIQNNVKNQYEIIEWFDNLKLNKPRFFPKRYTIKMLKKYEHYRERIWKKIDHGIYGGLAFLNDVLDLMVKKDKEKNKLCNWNKTLIDTYNICAWTIMCHNIFKIKPKDNSESNYRIFGLDNLIIDKRIINLKRHPLLFLFCLVDTIEPLKNGIENVQIKISNNKINIILDNNSEKTNSYIENLKGLKEWLTNAKSKNDNTIEISL